MLQGVLKSFRTGVVGLGVLVGTGMAGTAFGQGFGGGAFRSLQDINEPEYNARDIVVVTDVLTLDEGQRTLVQAFLDEYQGQFREESDNYREKIDEIRESIRDGGMEGRDWREMIEPIREATEEFRGVRSQLGEQFVSDLQAGLTLEQTEQWPEVERVKRRQKLAPRGVLSGESVDLVMVADGAVTEPTERARLDTILNDYAMQLDQALQQREADMLIVEEEAVEAFRGGDLDAAMSAIEHQLRLRIRVRDINEQFARQIEAELGGDHPAFKQAYLEAAYPSVYGEDYYEELFAAALNLPDLDETQRENVTTLQQSFEQRMITIDQDLARTVRENEPKRMEQMVEMMRARMEGGDRNGMAMAEDPIREGFNNRREIGEQFKSQLEGLLRPEQAEELPSPPRRPQRGQGWGGPGGGRWDNDGDDGDNDANDDGSDDEDGDGQVRAPAPPPVDDRGFPPGLGEDDGGN